MLKRLKLLGAVLAAVVLMAALDLSWTFFDFSLTTATLASDGTPYTGISTDIPEPATMMLLGTGLLAAFRARRRQQV